eukprot:CAMPEP_0171900438 /NCGR_PEP_ID=MMETSP0992-20121227/49776_1 /TAXON_ID=483369 /ORGANISM="non described non described, Strain CCMP2098" /LENGTH=193 /DNA_ID=CAMNT_0012528847 /DNA_START=883 /DNA_END=1461 /DNA_ORIENTATION=-
MVSAEAQRQVGGEGAVSVGREERMSSSAIASPSTCSRFLSLATRIFSRKNASRVSSDQLHGELVFQSALPLVRGLQVNGQQPPHALVSAPPAVHQQPVPLSAKRCSCSAQRRRRQRNLLSADRASAPLSNLDPRFSFLECLRFPARYPLGLARDFTSTSALSARLKFASAAVAVVSSHCGLFSGGTSTHRHAP